MSASATKHAGRAVLLGPQRDLRDIGAELDALGVRGPVALITAGWQEYEEEDAVLRECIGRPAVNLALHARSEAVYEADPTYHAASNERQKRLHRMQEFYRVRLDAIDDADHAISVRHEESALLGEELGTSVDQFRHLDQSHLDRIRAVHAAFGEELPGLSRPAIAEHRAEVAALVRDADAVVLAGGHVISMHNRIRLFDALRAVGDRPIVAWSAGAMVLTDRIVLFHDHPPFGKNLAQVVDEGLGICPGIVAMPDASRRVDLYAARGIARFASRMLPARCLTLDPGERLVVADGKLVEARSRWLGADGTLRDVEVAA